MEKSKIGISINLFAALLFFLGAAGSVLPVIVAAVYIWAFEENATLKKMAVKALMLTVFLSIIMFLSISLTTFISSVIQNFVEVQNIRSTGTNEQWALVRLSHSGMMTVDSIIRIVIIIVHIIFGLRAYRQGDIKIRWIDNILDKHFQDKE